MKITAKNYAAQILRDMTETVKNSFDMKDDIDVFINPLLQTIKESQHFDLSENGKIFESKLKGLSGNFIRLPYQSITISYEITGMENIKKRMIVASETEVVEYKKDNGETAFDGMIVIFAFDYIKTDNDFMWQPAISGCGFPMTGWEDKEYAGVGVGLWNAPIELINTKKFLTAKIGIEAYKELVSSYQDQLCYSVMEFCEALSCSNVTHEVVEKIDPAMNSKRIRSGKLPMYETRILVINAGQKSTSSEGDGTHASPRKHLRRRHIRKHPSAGNIWINSCVVGDKANGVIEKSYEVKGLL